MENDSPTKTTPKDGISGNSWFGAFSLLMSGFMSFYTLAYHYTGLGPLIPILQDIYNATYYDRYCVSMPEETWLLLLSITVSIMIAGGFIGGSGSKIMLTFFTRKHSLQIAHLLNIMGTLMIALVGGLSGSYEAFIIGRFLLGLPIGVFYSLIPLMIVEMSTPGKRALWTSSASIGAAFGHFCGPVMSHPKTLGTQALWPIAMAFPALPSIFYLIASLWIPETPYYLVRESRTQDAMDSLRKLRNGNDSELQHEMDKIEAEVYTNTNVVTLKEMFFTRQYRRQLIAVVGIYIGFALNGIHHLLFYTDQLFLAANITPEHVTTASIGVYGVQFLFGFAGPKLVDRFGSLNVNKGSTTTLILSLILFTISQATNHLAPTVMPIIAIVSVAMFLVGFLSAMQNSTLVLLGELTTEPTRPTVFAFGSTILWILSMTNSFIPPYMQIALGPYAMTIWIGTLILYLLFQISYLPDTRGKTIDEIQAHFK